MKRLNMNQNSSEQPTMHSRIFPAIWKLLQDETTGVTKYDVAYRCYCDHRSAQRILTHLHLEHEVYICSWRKAKKSGVSIPIYLIGKKKDATKPIPTRARVNEYAKEIRNNPDKKEKISKATKNKRVLKTMAEKFSKLTEWQYTLHELGVEM